MANDNGKNGEIPRLAGELRALAQRSPEELTERVADLSDVMPQEAYRFARLGDMLRDQARPRAAAIEYRKALDRLVD